MRHISLNISGVKPGSPVIPNGRRQGSLAPRVSFGEKMDARVRVWFKGNGGGGGAFYFAR